MISSSYLFTTFFLICQGVLSQTHFILAIPGLTKSAHYVRLYQKSVSTTGSKKMKLGIGLCVGVLTGGLSLLLLFNQRERKNAEKLSGCEVDSRS
jgi:hypothetical protein